MVGNCVVNNKVLNQRNPQQKLGVFLSIQLITSARADRMILFGIYTQKTIVPINFPMTPVKNHGENSLR
jgi:hypothetical protein